MAARALRHPNKQIQTRSNSRPVERRLRKICEMEDPLNFREMFKDGVPADEQVEKKNYTRLYLLAAGIVAGLAIWFSIAPIMTFLRDRREAQSIATLKALNPRVIKEVIGRHAVVVDLSGAEIMITPKIVEELKHLHWLRILDLSSSTISDSDLSYIKEMTHLTSLNLDHTAITDAGLAHLASLHLLEQLELKGTHITDAGLEQIKDLKSLTTLDLSETHITDAGLQWLLGMSQMTYLYLNETPITDAGLYSLVPLMNLLRLELFHTKVTVEGNKLFMFKTLRCQTQYNPNRRYGTVRK
jgi:hypothetical protein